MSLGPSTMVEGLRPPGQGPDSGDKPTRPHLRMWDRVKFILLFTAVWFLLCWAQVASVPIMSFQDAMREQLTGSSWVLVLLGLEVIRQIHYLISEFWSGYHRFWTRGVFGGVERFGQRRFSDWTRYRLARWIKWLFIFALAIYVISRFMHTSPVLAIFQLPALLWRLMPFVLQLAFAFFFVIFQFVGLFWFLSRGGIDTYFPDDIKTRFTDVWGQDHVVAKVKESIVFLERPHEIEAKGGYVPGGILLWGPPGTGKTLMAEAVAGETGKPYVFVDPGAFNNMFFGVGILKVKGLFRKLRKLALRYGGVIVFFDEADSLGSRGAQVQGGQGPPKPTMSPAFQTTGCHGFSYLSPQTQWMLAEHSLATSRVEPGPGVRRDRQMMPAAMGGGGGMGTLQALLTEMSGLKKPRGFVNRYVRRLLGMRPKPPPKYRILVMMATNMAEALDPALLRPGRIDRIYKVGYPSKQGRIRTYNGYLAKVRHELTQEQVDKLATITPYATGATIKDTVNESLIAAIRDGRDVIEWKDVLRAKQLKELGPPEDVEYIERERHAVAVHEACHAIVAYRGRRHMEIDIATIEKGSDYLGMVASVKPEDQFTHWRAELESDIQVSLASLAGERMFFDGDSSSGVSGDLESATYTATNMEALWGMGATVATLVTRGYLGVMPLGPQNDNDSAITKRHLANRIESNLGRLLEQVAEILEQNRSEILALAHALETHKTLNGEDVEAVLEKRTGPIVDGRIYGDPEFIRQIEAYHVAALVAHKDHAGIEVPIPVPPESGPPSQWAAPPAYVDGMPPVGPNGGQPPAAVPPAAYTAVSGFGPVPPASPTPEPPIAFEPVQPPAALEPPAVSPPPAPEPPAPPSWFNPPAPPDPPAAPGSERPGEPA
jgi:cell division protease FtsH